MGRKWCEHIEWDDGWNCWIIPFCMVDAENRNKLNFCPICGKPRPEKKDG